MDCLQLPQAPQILVFTETNPVADAILKLPFLRALRQVWPDADITWLTGRGQCAFAGRLAPLTLDLLDEVIEDAGIGGRAMDLLSKPLPGRDFDLVIDTGDSMLNAMILVRQGAKHFISAARHFSLSTRKPAPDAAIAPALTDRLIELVELISGAGSDPFQPLLLEAQVEAQAAALLPDGHDFVLLAPGAQEKHRAWPLNDFITVARTLATGGAVPVWLLEDGAESWQEDLASAEPSALFPLQNRVIREQGYRPDLIVALARRSIAGLSNASFTAHLLAAGGLPLVLLRGGGPHPLPDGDVEPVAEKLRVLTPKAWNTDDIARIPVVNVLHALAEVMRA